MNNLFFYFLSFFTCVCMCKFEYDNINEGAHRSLKTVLHPLSLELHMFEGHMIGIELGSLRRGIHACNY